MKSYFFAIYCALKLTFIAAPLVLASDLARAETASIYGGRDGLCGRPTASGERLNCAGMTAAHRTLAFGTRVRVCHSGCVMVRINDRGPWVRGRHIDLSPAAARAIGLSQTGRVTMTVDIFSLVTQNWSFTSTLPLRRRESGLLMYRILRLRRSST